MRSCALPPDVARLVENGRVSASRPMLSTAVLGFDSARCPRSGIARDAKLSLVVVERPASERDGIRFLLPYAPGVAVRAEEGSRDLSRVALRPIQPWLPTAGVVADSAMGVVPTFMGVRASSTPRPICIGCGPREKSVTSLRDAIRAATLLLPTLGGDSGGLSCEPNKACFWAENTAS